MGMPQLVVTAVLVERRSKSEVARQYGVSRRWVITLVQRYLAEGEAGLAPRSRRPLRSPRRTPVEVEDEIVKIRKELDRGGHEAGAATIAFHLTQRHGSAPAVSTIWRILTARGFVTPQPHKRPKSSYTRFVAEQPNERWQLDITHWTLADDTEVEILNLLDDHSRLCVGSHAQRGFKAGDVDDCFGHAATHYGDPATVLSDNGAVFTGRSRGQGRVALEVTLQRRGIRFRHSRPYHPQTCGKVERFHQTLKRWLTTRPRARTSASSKPSSTPSAATTTASGPTAPLAGAPRSRPTRPGPRRSRPVCPSTTPTTAFATTRSTPAGSSPCATTAGSTTSALAAATPAPTSWSWSTSSTSGSSPTTANSSESSSSTRPRTTNHSTKRERCRKTPVHSVPRHHRGA
jgi:transposase InsO family protein